MEINLDFVEEILYDLSNHSEDSFVTKIANQEYRVQVSKIVYEDVIQGYDIQYCNYDNEIEYIINLCDYTCIAMKNNVIIGAIGFYNNPKLANKVYDIHKTRSTGRYHSADPMS